MTAYVHRPQSLLSKLLALNWGLNLLLLAVGSTGFLMLYAAADGALDPWARAQMIRFAVGFAGMIAIAMIHIGVWRALAPFAYVGAMGLLVLVEFFGVIGMGAQRWIDLGPYPGPAVGGDEGCPRDGARLLLRLARPGEGLAPALDRPAARALILLPTGARADPAEPRHRDAARRGRGGGDLPRGRQPVVLRGRRGHGRGPGHGGA
jgi:hypothetical protein